MRLENKVVVVTGASSGVGREIALRFAKEGAKVVAVARRAERLAALEEASKEFAGEIVALVGLKDTTTGDTLCDKNKNIILTGIEFLPPVLSMSVTPESNGDEEKIISGLTKLTDEDPTFTVTNNTETKQTLITLLSAELSRGSAQA